MAKLKTTERLEEKSEPLSAGIHEPTHLEIQERAYYRYVERGQIDGFDREDWYLAETELRGGEEPAGREPDAPIPVPERTESAEVRSRTSGAKTGLVSV